MPVRNVVVSTNSTEKQFISAFIKSIMAESVFVSQHSLVCKIGNNTNYDNSTTVSNDTEVDTQLDTVYANSSNKPSVWFCIDDYIRLNILGINTLSSGGRAYYFHTYFNGSKQNGDIALEFYTGSGTPYPSDIKDRAYKYQIVSNSNALFIVFGGAGSQFPLTTTTYQSIFVYKKGTDLAYGNTVKTNLISPENTPLKVVDRLPYINNSTNPTAIEVIQNKVIATSAGDTKVITMDNIWDSSYNAAVMFEVTVNNSTCVYLNNYTLMLT